MNDITEQWLKAAKRMEVLNSTLCYVLGYLEGKPNRNEEETQILLRVRAAVFEDSIKNETKP